MALPTQSLLDIVRRSVSAWRSSFSGLPVGPKKFLGRSARAVAVPVWALQRSVEDLDLDLVPTRDSSIESLAAFATRIGLPDGAGGFGLLRATAASGGVASLTGVKGTAYPLGATATADDGSTQVELVDAAGVAIAGAPPGFGSVTAHFSAVTTGTAGNLPVGTRFAWDSPPAGADGTFALTTALSKGTDVEDADGVFARITTKMQNPPGGGRAADYLFWTENATDADGDLAIGVYVYPRRNGTGSVDVVVTVGGDGVERADVPADLVTAIEAAVAAGRPVTVESVRVLAPTTLTGHTARVRVDPSSRYPFDWVDTAASYAVDAAGYAAGPPATLRLAALAPASLKDAVDAFIAGAGEAPRLQVASTGAVVNVGVRAVAWSDGGGQTTLTLESLPDGWVAPSDGDAVFAGGDVVAPIAAGLAALVGALGPARGAYGSDDLPWRDTLTISSIVRVAEDALAADGTRLVDEVLVDGATVDGLEADVVGSDTLVAAPELLFLDHALVTQ